MSQFKRMCGRFEIVMGLALSLVSISNSGCSSKSNSDPFSVMRSVTGSVVVDGKPAAYAKLTFNPVMEDQQELGIFAKADENGEFTVLVPTPTDGGDAIEYHVGISWRIPRQPHDRNDPGYGKELLPKKFQDPKKSGLKVEIDRDMTELPPFDLKP